MAVLAASDEEMRGAVKALEQALYNHEQWSESLYAALVCRLPPDERDLSADAHRRCRFGQWFYEHGVRTFGRHPGFAQIESEHERMHKAASLLLYASAAGDPILLQSYERFVNAMQRMRLEIATLKRELEDTLYNLDPLTGTPSRIGMLTKLRDEQALVSRKVHSCTVAMLDIDRFKLVNDAYGHMVGDKVLVAVAHYAMNHLRPYDKVFRYGGEEFLLCLPDAELAGGREVLERVREGIAALSHEGSGRSFNVTVSIGLTLLDPDAAVEQCIDRADRALYAAKAAGRNCTMIWDASMGATALPTS
jgi:diguanylate cyclase (GGDEF)-like protein